MPLTHDEVLKISDILNDKGEYKLKDNFLTHHLSILTPEEAFTLGRQSVAGPTMSPILQNDLLLLLAGRERYTKGWNYFSGHRVTAWCWEPMFSRFTANVKGDIYSYSVKLTIEPYSGLEKTECTCPDHTERKEFCKHIVASCLQYNEFVRRSDVGVATSGTN